MEEEARKRAARKRAAAKRKKYRRRRLMVLAVGLLIVALLVVGIVSLVIRAVKKNQQASALEPTAPAASAMAETALPSAALTPEPTIAATPVPATPAPAIQADWYIERMEQLYKNLSTYGNYPDAAALYKALDEMQIDPNGKMLALTFDDGPYPPITGAILDVLEANHARATFFIKGAYVDANQDLVKRELGLGCEIGNHTTNHDDLEKLSPADRRTTVGDVNDKIYRLFGYRIHLLRPPYISYGKKGSDTREDIVAMAKELELAIVNHTRSSHDSHEDYTAQMMIDRILAEKDELGRGLNGSILLFHDTYQKTVEAMKVIIPALQQQGYQLVTVSELLNCSKEGLHYGWIYSKAD
ncbi:MAG: polysaccharide deacetylase family protein [Clostridia bacterium]|nr:polysaccharide deacetylase family protein [Clostridia bacterium]